MQEHSLDVIVEATRSDLQQYVHSRIAVAVAAVVARNFPARDRSLFYVYIPNAHVD